MKKTKEWFTVVGVYVDTNQVFTQTVKEETAQDAVKKVADQVNNHTGGAEELLLVGAVRGRNRAVYTPTGGRADFADCLSAGEEDSDD